MIGLLEFPNNLEKYNFKYLGKALLKSIILEPIQR